MLIKGIFVIYETKRVISFITPDPKQLENQVRAQDIIASSPASILSFSATVNTHGFEYFL